MVKLKKLEILMCSLPIFFFLRQEWRESFPNFYSAIGYLLGTALELLIYWYTAKAFAASVPAEKIFGGGYFDFVVFGELTLIMPAAAIGAISSGVGEAIRSGLLEALLLEPISPMRIFLYLGAAGMLRSFVRWIALFVLAVSVFSFSISLEKVILQLVLMLVTLPLFLALGVIAAAFYLRFGRGANALNMLLQAATVLAGVYFPTTLFPSFFREALLFVSPFSALLELSRAGSFQVLAGEQTVYYLLGWTLFSLLFARLALEGAVRNARDRGSLLVAHHEK